MSHHPSFLLGEALEALAEITEAAGFVEALLVADNALARIRPGEKNQRAADRGAAAFRIGDGAGAPPAAVCARPGAGRRDANSTPAPSPQLTVVPDPELCEHRRGGYVCTRTAHTGPGGHVYVSGSWVPDRHHGAS